MAKIYIHYENQVCLTLSHIVTKETTIHEILQNFLNSYNNKVQLKNNQIKISLNIDNTILKSEDGKEISQILIKKKISLYDYIKDNHINDLFLHQTISNKIVKGRNL